MFSSVTQPPPRRRRAAAAPPPRRHRYLSNRTQFVEIDGQISSQKQIMCRVPQWLILGPLLFLLYVNDIHKSCESGILSFTDDTTSYIRPQLDIFIWNSKWRNK